MAMVTCPKCKKIVSNTPKACPNCGSALKSGLFDNGSPKAKKLHMMSKMVMGISCVLMILERMNFTKTYAGALLFGVGFLLHGLSLQELEKEKDYDGKTRSKIIIAISIAIMIIGAGYIYIDLK